MQDAKRATEVNQSRTLLSNFMRSKREREREKKPRKKGMGKLWPENTNDGALLPRGAVRECSGGTDIGSS